MRRWLWRVLVLEAVVWLILSGLALRVLPFRWLIPVLGAPQPPDTGGAVPVTSAEDILLARRAGAAVGRASGILPWKPNCLPQAMAAKAMLGRRHVRTRLCLGAMPEDGGAGIAAHAWLMLGAVPVIGGAVRLNYAELVGFC